MFAAALIIVAKKWERPKCPSTDGKLNKMYIRGLEYHLAITGNEVLIHDTMLLSLENIKPSERRHKRPQIV